MSRSFMGALFGLALLSGAPPAQAQDGTSTEAALRARLEALEARLPAVTEAQAAVLAQRAEARLRNAAAAVDTLRIGRVSVLAAGVEAPLGLASAQAAWNRRFPGLENDPAFDGLAFVFSGPTMGAEILTGERVHHVRLVDDATPALGRDAFELAFARVLLDGHRDDPRYRTHEPTAWEGPWMQVNYHAPTDEELLGIYRELAATPSRSVRACYSGDSAACRSAFGLDPARASMADWYDPEEIRRLVSRISPGRMMLSARGIEAEFARCLQREDDAACARVVDQVPYLTRAPLSGQARNSLLWFAVQRGGEAAWSRFFDIPENADIDQALSAAAGLPSNELLAQWRAWILERRPLHAGGAGGLAVTTGLTLVWVLAFTALGARSKRCRLG